MGLPLLLLLASLQTPAAKPGVIRGHVSAADTGQPIKRALIGLKRPNGVRAADVITDAEGNFEMRNVSPGTYLADASKSGYATLSFHKGREPVTQIEVAEDQTVKDVDFTLQPWGVITGVVTDVYDDPIPGVVIMVKRRIYREKRAELQLVTNYVTDDRGRYRVPEVPPGHYYVQARSSSSNDALPAYETTLYPASTTIAGAQPVAVGIGEEVPNINFKLKALPVYNVNGVVSDLRTGTPAGVANIIFLREIDGANPSRTRTRPDGSFRLLDVTPGSYRVTIEIPAGPGQPKPLSTDRHFEMPDHKVTGAVFAIGHGATVKGRVIAVGGDLPEKLQVRLSQGNGNPPLIETVSPEGAFSVADVQPGNYQIQIVRPGAGSPFFTSSLAVKDKELVETGSITVADSVPELDVAATIDFRTGTINGTVFDAENKPMDFTEVVLVSADPDKRGTDRHFKHARSGSTGLFKISGIIPGDYLLLLWPGQDPASVMDPDLMSQLERHCVRVSVAASGSVTQDVKWLADVAKLAKE